MSIRFHHADKTCALAHKRALKQFILNRCAREGHKGQVQLSIIFCSDEYLLGINRQFLNHDYYTDIITFPLTSTPQLLDAEIYISIDRVKENSLRFSKATKALAFHQELHRVIFHGVLHLLGYADKSPAQQKAMRAAEDKWLRLYEAFLSKQSN
jgi:probable rRNA maturation factor